MLKTFLKASTPLCRFLREERAALSIEAAIMLPVLGFVYVAGFGYFDAYRREAVLTKATYTMGDLLSREEGTITPVDLEGLQDVFEFLTFSEGETWLRTTEVRRNGDSLEVVWSYATDGNQVMTDTRLQGYLDQVPTLQHNERVVLVESFVDFEPAFGIGLQDRRFERLIATSQRYAARLDYDPTVVPDVVVSTSALNNGWGNGDQDAPGKSLDTNNAENGGGTPPPGQGL